MPPIGTIRSRSCNYFADENVEVPRFGLETAPQTDSQRYFFVAAGRRATQKIAGRVLADNLEYATISP